ncbi:MAG: hypothetical protein L6R38_009514 [Xanthoria sp. 2 TBL-2021]|nr:MAG: hypothetical protein L6R38_009514 [Xanthoria sp. 2 TBL-2021]
MSSVKCPPVVDFSDYLSGDAERMKRCADQIGQACKTQGLFQIINHPIPASLQKEMFKMSKYFFAIPLEEKMKLDKAPNADALQRGIGAHRDFGIITLLLQGDVPGLEVWDEETKSYYDAPPVEGAYVVNLGNLFEQWTNDKYLSNVHRVINKSSQERYSIPSNYNGNPDFIIKCIETCRARPEDEKYAPISVEDYVRQKYEDVYGRVGIYKVAEKTTSDEREQQHLGEEGRLDRTVNASAPGVRAY